MKNPRKAHVIVRVFICFTQNRAKRAGEKQGPSLKSLTSTVLLPSHLPPKLPRPGDRLKSEMSVGLRRLSVLGEFKPFGLISEALDGKPSDTVLDNYDYFVFDPQVARERDESDADDAPVSALSDRCDHELFIRGNR